MHDYLVPPDDVSGVGHDDAPNGGPNTTSCRRFVTNSGHDVHALGVKDDLGRHPPGQRRIQTPHRVQPLEAFHEVGTFDQNVVVLPGTAPAAVHRLQPARHVARARQSAVQEAARTTTASRSRSSRSCARGRKPTLPKRLAFPVIVKSLTQEASIGISQASVVEDEGNLRERVQFIHESIGTDAIIEQYIEGRELYCAILGNQRLQVFPVWEMTFANMPEGQHRIATERVKWNVKYQNEDRHRDRRRQVDRRADLGVGAAHRPAHLSRPRAERLLARRPAARCGGRVSTCSKPTPIPKLPAARTSPPPPKRRIFRIPHSYSGSSPRDSGGSRNAWASGDR